MKTFSRLILPVSALVALLVLGRANLASAQDIDFDTIDHGVDVPDTANYPMPFQYYTAVGPKVYLTAVHVILGEMRRGTCEANSPARMGLPVRHNPGGLALFGLAACAALDSDFGWQDLKRDPLLGGYREDWALVVDRKGAFGPAPTTYLTLDFKPVEKGETLVIVGKGRTDQCEGYNYTPGASKRAAAFKVEETARGIAWMSSAVRGRATCVGDSGSAWLRVNGDGNVSAVGAHSAGLSGVGKIPVDACLAEGRCFTREHSWAGLFDGEAARGRIEKFARDEGVEICGVNRDCAPVQLPVSMNDLMTRP